MLRNRRVTDEFQATKFCLVEQSFNSGPLEPVISDAKNLVAPTPNHFLLETEGSTMSLYWSP